MTVLILALLAAGMGSPADPVETRTALLNELTEILPKSAPFSDYLAATGDLPPDFTQIVPDARVRSVLEPLVDGRIQPIATEEGWRKERERLLGLAQEWFFGTCPPAPASVEAAVKGERREQGCLFREVELRFGPGNKAKLSMQLWLPDGPGPFPVFITQDNHLGWGMIALRRGYAVCVYAGADSRDDTDTFLEAYPGYTWSRLARRGWAAGRCIDHLTTLPQIDPAKIALTGHSRNGKTSLMGAALDPRVAVVISSSSGAGGTLPARECGEECFAEGIESITRTFPEWFLPRWRFFAGREHLCPVDMQHLIALSAPRPCLLSIALNDNVEHGWALQRSYLAVRPAWELAGAPDKLRILWRHGGHETWPTVIERYVDWCDLQFGRGGVEFPEKLPFPWDWNGWKSRAGALPAVDALPASGWDGHAAAPQSREETAEAVRAMLGAEPPAATVPVMEYGKTPDHVEKQLGRLEPGAGLECESLVFGEYINADVWRPKGKDKQDATPLPAILWLPPRTAPSGYGAAYKRGDQPYQTLARAGYAVFCFDPAGTGRRVDEVDGFYDRHPDWSLMGRMLRDCRAALDVMASLPCVDPKRIHVLGYAQGALLAMHLAALDDRPAGYVLVAPPLPFRLDRDTMRTGGVLRWAQDSMLLPRLGLFAGMEGRIPYDLDNLAACIAPKPLLVVHPTLDRFAPPEEFGKFRKALEDVYKKADASALLTIYESHTYNQFDGDLQESILVEMEALLRASFRSK